MRISYKSIFLALAILLAVQLIYADQAVQKDQPVKLDLEKCIAVAIKNNPELSAAQWQVKTAQAAHAGARGKMLPELDFKASYNYFREDRLITPRREGDQSVLDFTDEQIDGNVVLSIPLYNGGSLHSAASAAGHAARASKLSYQRSQRELIFNVTNVYYSILGQRAVIEALQASEAALLEHNKRITKLIDAHKAAPVDLLRTEVRLADIRQQLIKETNVLNIQKQFLISLIGTPSDHSEIELAGELKNEKLEVAIDDSAENAFSRRYDHKALLASTDMQQSRLASAKGKAMPDVSLKASYGQSWDADSSADNEVGQVGVFVQVPLYKGGQIKNDIVRQRYMLNYYHETRRKLELQIQLELKTALLNIASARSRVSVTEKAVAQSYESLRIEQEKYEQGKGAIVDVLDAQSAMLESQKNYHRALAGYRIALAQYKLAAGE